jgi:flagellar protein FliS
MFSPFQPRATSAYQRISTETSMHTIDQHKLVSLLYEGVLSSIAAARGAMARGDIPGKCNAIGKAIRIIEEGLLTALDRDAGGELAENLSSVYEYALRQLVLANAHNDDAKLEEVAQLIQPIASSWEQIKEAAQGMPSAANNKREGGVHA